MGALWRREEARSVRGTEWKEEKEAGHRVVRPAEAIGVLRRMGWQAVTAEAMGAMSAIRDGIGDGDGLKVLGSAFVECAESEGAVTARLLDLLLEAAVLRPIEPAFWALPERWRARPDIRELLYSRLASRTDRVKWRWVCERPEAQRLLVRGLAEPAQRWRQRCKQALEKMATRAAIPLCEALHAPSKWTRRLAAEILMVGEVESAGRALASAARCERDVTTWRVMFGAFQRVTRPHVRQPGVAIDAALKEMEAQLPSRLPSWIRAGVPSGLRWSTGAMVSREALCALVSGVLWTPEGTDYLMAVSYRLDLESRERFGVWLSGCGQGSGALGRQLHAAAAGLRVPSHDVEGVVIAWVTL